jgi:hypothetical protein
MLAYSLTYQSLCLSVIISKSVAKSCFFCLLNSVNRPTVHNLVNFVISLILLNCIYSCNFDKFEREDSVYIARILARGFVELKIVFECVLVLLN